MRPAQLGEEEQGFKALVRIQVPDDGPDIATLIVGPDDERADLPTAVEAAMVAERETLREFQRFTVTVERVR